MRGTNLMIKLISLAQSGVGQLTGLFCLVLISGCDTPGLFQKPQLDVHFAGTVKPSIIFSHEFTVQVWHQNPGTVKNGVLTVTVKGAHLRGKTKTDVWSFDSWPPNQSSARTFTYELEAIGDDLALDVEVQVRSAGTLPRTLRDEWRGSDWKSRSKVVSKQ